MSEGGTAAAVDTPVAAGAEPVGRTNAAGHEVIDLDVIGAIEGTDKSSSVTWSWDYLRGYQPLFAEWRHAPVNLVEIGVLNGESLHVWERFFSRATIVGVDINPACARFAGGRVQIRIGSQEDPGFLHTTCAEFPPTIFIDDGSHQAHHIVYTFERVFPALAAGGLYIIEDLAFHFGDQAPNWRGNGSVSVPDYLAALARSCMARRLQGGEAWGTAGYIAEHLDSITFLRGAAVLRKKKKRNIGRALQLAREELSRRAPSAEADINLARFILRHHGPLDEAETLARRAVERSNEAPSHVITLADVLQQRGAVGPAMDAVRSALQAHADSHELWWRLGAVERERGHIGEAVKALERAVALRPADPSILRTLSLACEQAGDLARAAETMELALQHAPGWRSDPANTDRIAALRVGMAGR